MRTVRIAATAASCPISSKVGATAVRRIAGQLELEPEGEEPPELEADRAEAGARSGAKGGTDEADEPDYGADEDDDGASSFDEAHQDFDEIAKQLLSQQSVHVGSFPPLGFDACLVEDAGRWARAPVVDSFGLHHQAKLLR